MNKSKKIVATILNFVLVCFIALSIALLVPACNKVPTENNKPEDNTPHTEHSYVYTEVDDINHKKTCSGCTEIDELEAHNYEDSQDTTCNYCDYVREIAGGVYPYSTPSGATFTPSKTALTAGDTFTVTAVIETNMPDCIWHSVCLNFTALDSNGAVDTATASYFEYVSHTTSLNEDYYIDSSSYDFNAPSPLTCGMTISISNCFTDPDKTLATDKIVFTIELKVKDDAPTIQNLTFGVAPIQANFIRLKNTKTNETINYSANNKTSINMVPDTTAGDCIT